MEARIVLVAVLIAWCSVVVQGRQGTLEQIDGISSKLIQLAVSEDGSVHTGSTNQYYRYRRGGELLSAEVKGSINSLIVDRTGNAYFTANYHYFVPNNDSNVEERGTYSSYNTNIRGYVDKDNYVYVADSLGVYIVRANGTKSKINGLSRYVTVIIEDNQGFVYFGHGADVFDRNVAVLYPLEKDRPTPAARKVNGISDASTEPIADAAVDSQDNIYFGIVGSKTALKKLTSDGMVITLLPFGMNKVAVDRQDRAYATSWGYQKEINLFAVPANSQFPVYVEGLSRMPKDFLDIKIDTANNAYFATAETTIYLLPGGDLGNVITITGIPNSQPFQGMLLDQEQNLIILLEDIFVLSSGATKATRVLGLPAGTKQMALAPDNSVYIATDEGLYRLA